jgi:Tol biopolymer transport system component
VAAKRSRSLLNAPGWSLKLYGGSWSPDGKKIVFCGNFEGKDRLATIAEGGANDSIEILYTNEENNKQLLGPPAWSADGKQILFSKQTTDNAPRRWFGSYLYSLAVEPKAKPVLLEGKQIGNINRAMSFSPDGKRILFSSER